MVCTYDYMTSALAFHTLLLNCEQKCGQMSSKVGKYIRNLEKVYKMMEKYALDLCYNMFV